MRRALQRTERCLASAASLSKPAFPSRRFLHESRADAVAYAEVWNVRAHSCVIGTSTPSGTWFTYHAAFPNGATASHVGFYWLPGEAWSGTMYLDRVKLSM